MLHLPFPSRYHGALPCVSSTKVRTKADATWLYQRSTFDCSVPENCATGSNAQKNQCAHIAPVERYVPIEFMRWYGWVSIGGSRLGIVAAVAAIAILAQAQLAFADRKMTAKEKQWCAAGYALPRAEDFAAVGAQLQMLGKLFRDRHQANEQRKPSERKRLVQSERARIKATLRDVRQAFKNLEEPYKISSFPLRSFGRAAKFSGLLTHKGMWHQADGALSIGDYGSVAEKLFEGANAWPDFQVRLMQANTEITNECLRLQKGESKVLSKERADAEAKAKAEAKRKAEIEAAKAEKAEKAEKAAQATPEKSEPALPSTDQSPDETNERPTPTSKSPASDGPKEASASPADLRREQRTAAAETKAAETKARDDQDIAKLKAQGGAAAAQVLLRKAKQAFDRGQWDRAKRFYRAAGHVPNSGITSFDVRRWIKNVDDERMKWVDRKLESDSRRFAKERARQLAKRREEEEKARHRRELQRRMNDSRGRNRKAVAHRARASTRLEADRQWRRGQSAYIGTVGAALGHDTAKYPDGATWRMRIRPYAGAAMIPVIENVSTSGTGGISSENYSTNSKMGGATIGAEALAYPYFSEHAALGAFVDGGFAFMGLGSTSSSAYWWATGLRARLGAKSLSGLGELSYGGFGGSLTSDVHVSAGSVSGSSVGKGAGDGRSLRLGIGADIGWPGIPQNHRGRVLLTFDSLSYSDDLVPGLRLTYDHENWFTKLDFRFGLPNLGVAAHGLHRDYSDKAVYWGLSLGYQKNLYGRPWGERLPPSRSSRRFDRGDKGGAFDRSVAEYEMLENGFWNQPKALGGAHGAWVITGLATGGSLGLLHGLVGEHYGTVLGTTMFTGLIAIGMPWSFLSAVTEHKKKHGAKVGERYYYHPTRDYLQWRIAAGYEQSTFSHEGTPTTVQGVRSDIAFKYRWLRIPFSASARFGDVGEYSYWSSPMSVGLGLQPSQISLWRLSPYAEVRYGIQSQCSDLTDRDARDTKKCQQRLADSSSPLLLSFGTELDLGMFAAAGLNKWWIRRYYLDFNASTGPEQAETTFAVLLGMKMDHGWK